MIVNDFLELIFISNKILLIELVLKMSYFDSENEYDPWAPVNSAPAYSFGGQPAAPQPSFAAQEPDLPAPQPAFAAQPEAPQAEDLSRLFRRHSRIFQLNNQLLQRPNLLSQLRNRMKERFKIFDINLITTIWSESS